MSDQEYIDKVFNDKEFPSHPRIKVGEKNNKPIYSFFLDKASAYVQDGKVKCDFVNSMGQQMRYSWYYANYNVDRILERMNKELQGDFKMLITGTEFK